MTETKGQVGRKVKREDISDLPLEDAGDRGREEGGHVRWSDTDLG